MGGKSNNAPTLGVGRQECGAILGGVGRRCLLLEALPKEDAAPGLRGVGLKDPTRPQLRTIPQSHINELYLDFVDQ